jgi:hypothetical protein
MAKSKFFRVGTEGDTTDGRKVERSWIQQMADNFDRTLYGARVWLEHFRGLYPDSTFRAYGDVLALEAREVEDGKLALFAQIDPTDDLVAMNKARQKIYTSMEVDPNFARRGHAYLVGLAVTDTPASLGTELLAFSAAHPDTSPLKARKVSPDNIFTAATPTTIEFEDAMPTVSNHPAPAATPAPTEDKTLLSRIKELIGSKPAEAPAPAPAAPQFSAEDIAGSFALLAEAQAKQASVFAAARTEDAAALKALKDQITALSSGLQEVSAAFDAFRAQLDAQPANSNQRPPAAGGDGKVVTDC